MKTILKTLVGSRAHGLHTEDSDYDYRGVFVVPTRELVSLDVNPKSKSWMEGDVDDTAYELRHFLNLAVRSNPSVLEVLCAPVQESTEDGEALRALFPYLWSSVDVANSCLGYAKNQEKKFLDQREPRPWKFAVAYLRVLVLGEELLSKGTMTMAVPMDMKSILREVKAGKWTKGQVVDMALELRRKLEAAFEKNPDKQCDRDKAQDFLLDMRKKHW